MKHIDAETAFDPLVTGWMKNFVRQHAVIVPNTFSLWAFAFGPPSRRTSAVQGRNSSRLLTDDWSRVDQYGPEAVRPIVRPETA